MIIVIFLFCLIMFPLSAIDKILKWPSTPNRLSQHLKWLSPSFSNFLVVCAMLLQIIAPVLIMYSVVTGKMKNIAILSAIALALFTLLATIVFYFPPKGNKYYALLGNTTTFGCMLLIAFFIKNYL